MARRNRQRVFCIGPVDGIAGVALEYERFGVPLLTVGNH